MADTDSSRQNGGIRSTVSDTAASAYNYAQQSLNRVVPPSRREQAYHEAHTYATTRPVIFAFAASQLIFCFLPVLLFTFFSLSTVAFALGCAIFFSLFWVGVAFMLLVPALLVCFSLAFLVWAWAVGSFFVARWVWSKIPVGAKGGVTLEGMGKEIHVIKDERGVDGTVEQKNY